MSCGTGVSPRLSPTTDVMAGWRRAWRTSSVPTKPVEPPMMIFIVIVAGWVTKRVKWVVWLRDLEDCPILYEARKKGIKEMEHVDVIQLV